MKKVFFAVIILFISCKGNKNGIYSGVFTGEEYICRAQVGGKVISFPYNEGDRINKGDTLIVIEDRELRMAVISMEYEVKNLRIQLKDAKEDFKKAESLYKAAAISEVRYEIAERKYQSLGYQLKSAEAALEAKKENLKNFHITAPSSGYISIKYIKEGEVAMPGTPLAEIVDPDVVYLNIYIPENEIPKVLINQDIRVKVDAFHDRIFKGRVIFI